MNKTLGRKSERALTFLELIASMTILLLLASMAVPLARVQLQRARESELRRDLRMMREAIDKYKNFSDSGVIPVKAGTLGEVSQSMQEWGALCLKISWRS
jgi:general secretion pathway protein G